MLASVLLDASQAAAAALVFACNFALSARSCSRYTSQAAVGIELSTPGDDGSDPCRQH